MKHIPEEFKQHLSGEVTTLCRCWILETTRGDKLGFTDHDKDIFLLGVACEKDAGVETSSMEERLGFNANSSDIAGALQSDIITAKHINSGKYDNAKIYTYIVNWSDTSQFTLDRVSLVGEISQQDGFYTMELRGLTSQLDQTKGNHFIARCQANLGDSKCKVDLNNPEYCATGSVISVKSKTLFLIDTEQDFEEGWFTNGSLEWLSGDNTGLRVSISNHAHHGSQIEVELWQSMPSDIQVSDDFKIIAGCNKSFETCKAKFLNQLNFRGFPHIPGNDETLSVASQQSVFDGGPIVP